MAKSSRAPILDCIFQFRSWSGGAGCRRIPEPVVLESRDGPDAIAARKSSVDSDGRLGSRIFLLGLGRGSVSGRNARSNTARPHLSAADSARAAIHVHNECPFAADRS